MFDRLRLAWTALSLYEEMKTMDTSMLVKIAVAFLSGLVGAASTAYLTGQPAGTAVMTGLAAGVTTALAYLKSSPLNDATVAPRIIPGA